MCCINSYTVHCQKNFIYPIISNKIPKYLLTLSAEHLFFARMRALGNVQI